MALTALKVRTARPGRHYDAHGLCLAIDDYLELDIARIMGLDGDLLDTGVTAAERDHWLAVFVAMFSRSAFERTGAAAVSFHDAARREAAFYKERVAKSLSELVFTRLYPTLGRAVANAAPADTPLDDIREATLTCSIGCCSSFMRRIAVSCRYAIGVSMTTRFARDGWKSGAVRTRATPFHPSPRTFGITSPTWPK